MNDDEAASNTASNTASADETPAGDGGSSAGDRSSEPANPLGIDPQLDALTNPERLRALRRYDVIGTPQEDLDRLTRLAARLYDAPIALLTLLGDERQLFISAQGTDLDEAPARPSVCRATIATSGPMVVENLADDERFADQYYVTGDLHLRFYAGAPLTTLDGHRIGTLCVYDVEPRTPDPELLGHLQDLADMGMEALERDQFSIGVPSELSQTVLDHLPGIFYVVDDDGRLRRWNARFQEVSGYTDDALEGRPAVSFFRGDDRETVEAAVREVFEEGSVTVEADFTTAQGASVPMLFTGVRTRIGGETRLVGMGVDISERKAYERQLKEAKEAAEAARREAERQGRRAEEASASKSRFLAGVAHDLKSPVSAVSGFAEILSQKLSGAEAEHAQRIQRAARQINAMAESLTELARLEQGELDLEVGPVDVPALVEQVLEDHRARIEQVGADVRAAVEAPARARANESALRRCVANLLENALTYAGAGEDIVLRARPNDAPDDDAVLLTVEDSGPGIDPDFMDRLFEPFARNAPDTDGTGLGLAVTAELVRAMDGTIDVDSEPGRGTAFQIRLPAPPSPSHRQD
jgi:PAS domain S-box-containing protein